MTERFSKERGQWEQRHEMRKPWVIIENGALLCSAEAQGSWQEQWEAELSFLPLLILFLNISDEQKLA